MASEIRQDVSTRFLEAMRAVIRKDQLASEAEFCRLLDIYPQVLSDIKSGKRAVTIKMLERFIRRFQISFEYIFYGIEPVFRSEPLPEIPPMPAQLTEPPPININYNNVSNNNSSNNNNSSSSNNIIPPTTEIHTLPNEKTETNKALPPVSSNNDNIFATVIVDRQHNPVTKLIPEYAHAGYLSHRNDPAYWQTLPEIALPRDSFRSRQTLGFQIRGDSMEPTIYNGDWVLCTRIEKWQFIRPNEVYCIVTEDSIQCKRLRYDAKTNTIWLISDNAYYAPHERMISEIKELWQFECLMRFYAPNPTADSLARQLLLAVGDLRQALEILNHQPRP